MSGSLDAERPEKNAESILRKGLTTVGMSATLAFVLSELIFFYFLDRGFLRYPENVLVPMFVLSVAFILIMRYLSFETAIMTYYASIIAVIFIVDLYFGSSVNASILRDYLSIPASGGRGYENDILILGFGGGTFWMGLILASQSAIEKLRKMPIKDARLPLRSGISKLTEFFDRHPWLVTVIMSVITLLIGLIIGGLGR